MNVYIILRTQTITGGEFTSVCSVWPSFESAEAEIGMIIACTSKPARWLRKSPVAWEHEANHRERLEIVEAEVREPTWLHTKEKVEDI